IENRRLYDEKFKVVTPIIKQRFEVDIPDGAFYLWARTDQPDTEVALRLYRDFNVTVLPGSYLAREAHGVNPGKNFVRLALVASLEECKEAANRILSL
ncbi:MAG: succinyldiaminopimelate transaminase, partial [Nitrosomonadales bacterium]|nr:succinyldiaminopimelate transaminase [Nitrosomonadales bacterium]